MTTIVYSRKHGVLAADSQITAGTKIAGTSPKIKDFGKFLVGVAGDFHVLKQVLDRKYKSIQQLFEYVNSFTTEGEQGFTCIVITKGTKKSDPVVYLGAGYKFPMVEAEWAVYYTLGSGAEIALGALHAGANPVEAIRISAQIDTGTNTKIDVINKIT